MRPSRSASTVMATSEGLSSTRRMWIGRPRSGFTIVGADRTRCSCGCLLSCGQGEPERAAYPARTVVDADLAAVPFHDLVTEREADPGAGVVLPAVQALEHAEDALAVLRRDADAVVGDREPPVVAVVPAGDVDVRPDIGRGEFHRVPDEVLEQLPQLAHVGPDLRQVAHLDLGRALVERGPECGEHRREHLVGVQNVDPALDPADA